MASSQSQSSSQQHQQHSYVDVMIIGAGPAGLMFANALSRAGVNLRIVDKRPLKLAAGQADGIQPRTVEVLQVSQSLIFFTRLPLFIRFTHSELWTSRTLAKGGQPDAHGGEQRLYYLPLLITSPWPLNHFNNRHSIIRAGTVESR
jgi:choline dehydrogenase-like flavoprotein